MDEEEESDGGDDSDGHRETIISRRWTGRELNEIHSGGSGKWDARRHLHIYAFYPTRAG